MSKLTDKQKIDILNYSIEEAKEIIEDLKKQNAELRDELDLKDTVILLMSEKLITPIYNRKLVMEYYYKLAEIMRK